VNTKQGELHVLPPEDRRRPRHCGLRTASVTFGGSHFDIVVMYCTCPLYWQCAVMQQLSIDF